MHRCPIACKSYLRAAKPSVISCLLVQHACMNVSVLQSAVQTPVSGKLLLGCPGGMLLIELQINERCKQDRRHATKFIARTLSCWSCIACYLLEHKSGQRQRGGQSSRG